MLSEIVGNLEKVMKTSVSAQELTQHISKWEDLPRGLLGLRNCITEWIKAVQAGMRQKDIHIQDLESQLQETMEQSEISESSLVSQLRDAQSEVTKLKASNKVCVWIHAVAMVTGSLYSSPLQYRINAYLPLPNLN